MTVPNGVRALRHRDFRFLLGATVAANIVMPMQFITLTFWAIDTYPGQKVLLSSLIVGVRGTGMLLVSLFGGAIADRFERRKVLLCCETAFFVLTALMGLAMVGKPFGDATIVAVLAIVFATAATMAIDGPSRSASIPVIVGPQDMGNAIGLNNVAQQLTFPAVLPLVGFLTATIGPGKVVLCSLLAWVFILPLIAQLRYSSRGHGAPRTVGVFRAIADGLGYARRDATIFAVVGMIVVLQVVGMPGVGMLGPIWMTEVLELSRTQFGFIAMLWGVGSVASALFFAWQGWMTRRGLSLVAMVVLFAVAGIVFAHSRTVWLTAVANGLLGFAMTAALVMGITIVQYTVVDEMRGRVMGLFPLVMGLSMVNVAPVGLAGQELGLETVVPALEWSTLILAVLITFAAPGLRHARDPGRGRAGPVVQPG
jgi:MFS family permease